MRAAADPEPQRNPPAELPTIPDRASALRRALEHAADAIDLALDAETMQETSGILVDALRVANGALERDANVAAAA